jgi:hypothetical protein
MQPEQVLFTRGRKSGHGPKTAAQRPKSVELPQVDPATKKMADAPKNAPHVPRGACKSLLIKNNSLCEKRRKTFREIIINAAGYALHMEMHQIERTNSGGESHVQAYGYGRCCGGVCSRRDAGRV